MILMAGVGLLMLIMCLNVAHLLLARGLEPAARSPSARAGRGQARLTRQLLPRGCCWRRGRSGRRAGRQLAERRPADAGGERSRALALASGGEARVRSFTGLVALVTAC